MVMVVTGASGHLGGTLVRMLLAKGERVRVLVHRDTAGLDGLDVERLTGDVRDPATLAPLVDGADTVFHCAAVISILGDPDGRVAETNVRGARNVAQAARQASVRRLVHVSSVHAFDLRDHGAPITEASPRATAPRCGAYDRSKWRGELEVRRAVEDGLDAVIVNPTAVVGPFDHRVSRMGTLFRQLRSRTLPALVPGGFDYVDVRDVCLAMWRARERGRTGHNYLVSGRWWSVRELARLVEAITSVRAPLLTVPVGLARLGAPLMTQIAKWSRTEPIYTAESLDALQANRSVRHDKAARELGHAPRAIEPTVRDVFAWLDDPATVESAWRDEARST